MSPSSIIALPPAPPSSAGWKITTAVPSKLRVSARYFAAPSSMAVWPSWPQACIRPGVLDAYGTPDVSSIGNASMSARRPMVLPEAFFRPRIMPTTPVRPMPVTTSSHPNSRSLSATIPAVRCTSYSSSGCAWKSCRQAVMSSARAAMRLTMGMVGLLPLELSGAWNSISGRAVLRVAEYALEDRVDVLEVVAEVELLVDLGVRQVFLYVRVLLQQRIEIAFAAPDRHRVALHQPVG